MCSLCFGEVTHRVTTRELSATALSRAAYVSYMCLAAMLLAQRYIILGLTCLVAFLAV